MSFESEPEAFEGWARAMPHNSVFLVDTYDTLRGVANAIEAGRKLAQSGHKLAAVRLDSGDLGQLSRRARAMLDEAGFTETKVLGSGDLDEHSIAQLKDQGAAIGLWGVGTRLAVAFDEPALGGVYKLGAIRSGPDVPWSGRMKRSETPGKSTLPGIIEAVRFSRSKGGAFVGDALLDRRFQDPQSLPVPSALTELAPDELLERSELLVPIYRGGQRVHTPADLETARGLRASQVQRLPWPCRSLSPREGTGYPVCLDKSLRPDQNGQAEG
jgi:nicotinate phosphoribosyltransferase